MGIHPGRPRNGLSLCAGYGGLDLGLQLAEPGFHTRCFVEVDPDAQAALVAGMVGGNLPDLAEHGAGPSRTGSTATTGRRARSFQPAPVWDDLRTFVGDGWRGHIDTILAGYPCQPFSAAGQRRGEDDERHLWPDIERIVGEIDPEWLFFENVAGHVSLGLETVLRRIWHMGFTPAAGLFSAGETGTAHERLRVFIVAHRPRQRAGEPDDAIGTESRERARPVAGRCGGRSDGQLAHTDGGHPGAEREQCGGQFGFQPEGRETGARHVGHSEGIGRREGWAEPAFRSGRNAPGGTGGTMDHAASARCQPERIGAGSGREGGQPLPRAGCSAVANASQQGSQGREQCGSSDQRHGTEAHGSTAERGRPQLHPPGPADADRWADILGASPYLAPAASLRDCLSWAGDLAAAIEGPGDAAAQSALCRMADGLAGRSRALRGLGNGVHPLAAGYAWRTLAAAHGLRPLDLGTAAGCTTREADEPVLTEELA